MTVPISVIVPVGPEPHQSAYLDKCLMSIAEQTEPPAAVILVGNGDSLDPAQLAEQYGKALNLRFIAEVEPLGIAGAFMRGIEVADTELVFLLGSDDRLYPKCLEKCHEAWKTAGGALGWYYVAVEYDNGWSQNTACLAAMMPKRLFQVAGPLKNDHQPYPSCEIEFISRMILAHGQFGATIRVSDDILYWVRIRQPGAVGIAV